MQVKFQFLSPLQFSPISALFSIVYYILHLNDPSLAVAQSNQFVIIHSYIRTSGNGDKIVKTDI